MRMKLPKDVLFHHDLQLMVWRPRGNVDENIVNKVVEFMAKEEARSHQPFNRFTDTLEIDEVDLTFRYVYQVSLYRRLSYLGRPPVKSAILVSENAFAPFSRLHQTLTQGSPLQVQIFEHRLEAANWLGVSLESLEY